MKILMIVSCFSPKNIIGAVRTSKIAKYLVREGHDVTVISPELENYDGIDNTLECEEFKQIRRITVPYSKFTTVSTKVHKRTSSQDSKNQVGNQINQSTKAKIYKWLRGRFSRWRDFEWTEKVKKIIKTDNSTYDVVISSYPNLSTHDAALYAKKAGKAKMWIADFRDPLVLESDIGIECEKAIIRQSAVVHNADIVTHVSKAGVEKFICDIQDKDKVIWIPNGFDEEDFDFSGLQSSDEEKELTIILSYAGGLYSGERDCSPLFKAIRELVNEAVIKLDNIRVDYAGRDYSILKAQADKYQVSDVIINNGLVSREQSLKMQAHSDCVIVATFCYQDNGGAMTGKIYEPVMMRKPILMMVSGPGKNSEPGAFVKDLNAGTVYEESLDLGDVTIIKKMIVKMIKEKRETGRVVSKIDGTKRTGYDYSNIVKSLIDRIQE